MTKRRTTRSTRRPTTKKPTVRRKTVSKTRKSPARRTSTKRKTARRKTRKSTKAKPSIKTNQTEKNFNKKSVSIGQTLETNDLYLPYKKSKKPQSKSRPVIVIDKTKNKKGTEEFAIVPGSTQKTKHTSLYGKNGIERFRHNIEIEDNDGEPITLNIKFQITDNSTIIPEKDIEKIYDKVLNHTKFSSENKKKIENFKNRNKKK